MTTNDDQPQAEHPRLAPYDRLVLRLLAEKVRTLLPPSAGDPPARNSQPLTDATED